MKEYDIFLKQRLTEGSIIVYSLPFRDGVSAVNRVVLRAMLSYFSLQKKIAVANQSALLSEIDEMLRKSVIKFVWKRAPHLLSSIETNWSRQR